MIGKASELKIHTVSWYAGFEIGRPSLQELMEKWLKANPNLNILQINYDLHPTNKQAIIIYKEGESS
jgi:hypothetical protein